MELYETPKTNLIKRLSKELDSESLVLIMYLSNYMDENNEVTISFSELSERIGLNAPYISRLLNEMHTLGYVTKIKEEPYMESMAVRKRKTYKLSSDFWIFRKMFD